MKYTVLALLSFLLLSACVQEEIVEEIYEGPETEKAVVVIHPTEGNEVSGVVTFTQQDDGIRVQAEITGLGSETLHGFHVHEYGDCRDSAGISAGGHYNPKDMPHAGPTDEERHMGDLGNLPANEDGIATLDYVDTHLKLNGKYSIVGYAVIVHEQRDDLQSQPVGDAGGRIGCGIIGVANPDY